jgi:hypothetical protein
MMEMNFGTMAAILLAVLIASLVLAMWGYSLAYGWFWGAMSAKDRWLKNKLDKFDYQKLVDDDNGYQEPIDE